MKKSGIISIIALTAGIFSANVNAQQSALEQFTGHLVSQAVKMTANELNQSVSQVVANTAYKFDLNGNAPVGKVEVTDIAKVEKPVENKKGDKSVTE